MKRYGLWKCDDGTYDVIEDGKIAYHNVSEEILAQAFANAMDLVDRHDFQLKERNKTLFDK